MAVAAVAVAAMVVLRSSIKPLKPMTFSTTVPLVQKYCLHRWFGNRWLTPGLVLALLVIMPGLSASAEEEQTFNSPAEAVKALVAAATRQDTNAIHAIFGPVGHQLISPDAIQATAEYQLFVKLVTQKVRLVTNSTSNISLEIGADGWPFPIPLVQSEGQWYFDSAAGAEEILARRIGSDELGAINVCVAYVDAQREYFNLNPLGDGVPAYAEFLHSTPGTHDGLYWPVPPGESLSPLGPLIAQARVDGYHRSAKMMNDEQAPYHGYYFKILTSQGKHAPGGNYNYFINGRLLAGFALVAWPAEWGNTGLMTFIVNQSGRVLQKNLGPNSVKIARAMTRFDPDATWSPAQ